jgi:hypothetical protein
MKKLLAVCAGVLFALLAIAFAPSAQAATDVTGSWTGSVSTPNGEFQLTFTFKQDGTKLTGTVQGPEGDPMDISNGKVDGEKIYFETSFNGTTIKHDGTVSGDEMKISAKSDDGNFPGMDMTLKRSK